ncbi:MAG: hypothetical protein QM756_27755 [Polyangiaceae bacterium]
MTEPRRPEALLKSEIRPSFVRGKVEPRGVVWFGIRSFWGHLRHFVASGIATEDIDSRDWMTPDQPAELCTRVIATLGGDTRADNVVDALGRDLWIDYISDTGDDVSVSAAVAELLFSELELPDPDAPEAKLLAPRGELLLFGGDTAYPVATAKEISNRVLVPFNQVLDRLGPSKPRVLLGIPGNHDWYDGLDGFGRMFRRRDDEDDAAARPSMLGVSKRMLEHYAEWARELVRGGKVEKPKALVISGYTPVQNGSYFVLPLSRTIHLFAADRQLKTLDSRQRRFLGNWYQAHPEVAPWVLLPDPLYAFGRPSPTGTHMIEALSFDFDARSHFLLAGDLHHYERIADERLLHVVAGGGGAFLHPAPMYEGRLRANMRWPDAKQSRALLRGVAWKVALGRSGFLPHLALAAIYSPALSFGTRFYARLGMILPAPILLTLLVGIVYSLIGGVREKPRAVVPLAFAAGLLTALVPVAASLAINRASGSLHVDTPLWCVVSLTLVAAVFLGAFIFGAYLALLTRLGLEHTQAFTALDHPGFKHFVRLRVRADGKGVDGWCIGLTDPLRPGERCVLVDQFQWRPHDGGAPRS